MTIRDGLALDHLYVSIPEKDFNTLALIFASQPGINREKVQAGDNGWEGLYAYTRAGGYFEFLRGTHRQGSLGIAISSYVSHAMDARKLREELPELLWKTGTRTLEDGKPWFDFLSLGDYLSHETTLFNAWIMHYHQNHWVPSRRRQPRAIDGLVELHVDAGIGQRTEIELKGAWLPGTNLGESCDEMVQVLPDRDGGDVRVRITFKDDLKGFHFRSLTFLPTREATWKSCRHGSWEIDCLDGQVRLNYRCPNMGVDVDSCKD